MKGIHIIFVVTIFSCSQANKEEITIDYCGQKPPGENAELFAPGIISTNAFEHSAPAFSPDGKTVLWSIMKMPSYHMSILEMNYVIGKWSSPHSPSFSDSTANDVYPCFSTDGKQLYFSSNRMATINDTSVKGNRIWKVEKNENGWGTPTLLDTPVSKGGEYASSIAENGNLYFTFGPHRSPDWNIHKSEKDNNKYSSPIILNFNSTGYEDGPCVAPDESYIIFESQRPESIDSSIDLFICFKKKDGQWSKPKNMGPKINSSSSERFSRVSPDGKYLFFGSNRNQLEKQTGFDIFWIGAKIIEELKKDTNLE
jgi:Tol biopolymer transport system component